MSRIFICKPTTIDTVLNIIFAGKVALIPRVVKFTIITRSGSTSAKGQSNTTISVLSVLIETIVVISISPGSRFLIGQEESMGTIVAQTEYPAQWDAKDIPNVSLHRALMFIAS
jgi:hypothetical protein